MFRKFSRVTGEKAPGAPGPEFPAAAGGGFSVGAPQLEAYLSTHPLDDERVRNVSALTSALERKTNADEREALCASFRKHVLARSGDAFVTGGFRLPRNASDGNRGAVAAPSDAWRAREVLQSGLGQVANANWCGSQIEAFEEAHGVTFDVIFKNRPDGYFLSLIHI